MKQKSIGQQIQSMSLLMIAGLLVLAVMSLATTLLLRTVFLDYRAASSSTLETVLVFEDFVEARIAALKGRSGDAPEFAEEFHANIAEIAQVSRRPDLAEGLAATLAELNADLTGYAAAFDRIVEAQEAYRAQETVLATTGRTTRQQLSEIVEATYADGNLIASYHAGRAQEVLMLGRYYIERFRQSERNEDLAIAKGHLEQAAQAVGVLLPTLQNLERRTMARAVQSGLLSYVEKAGQLAALVELKQQSRREMDASGPRMLANLEAALDKTVAEKASLGAQGMAITFWAVIAILALSGVIVAAAWVRSRKSAKLIVEDFTQSINVMLRLADGDLDAEVPAMERTREFGQMARALDVFKANGKASISAAQLEKQHERERQEAAAQQKAQQDAQDAAARAAAETQRKEMTSNLNQALGSVVEAASRGNFSKRVDTRFNDADLQSLADSVNVLVKTVDHGLSATGSALEKVASGDLTERLEGDFEGAFASLQKNTNGMIDALQHLIGEISGSGDTLVTSSAELKDTSDTLSRQAEQNALALEETSSALKQLSESIKQVSGGVSDASENARIASKTAQASGKVAADAAASMGKISDASSEISVVVSVITDIAFQINLLALNAGVEAARAGDAGRGFAVVAAEVRQLAQRASEASNDISSVILRSDEAVTEGVAKVADAQESLKMISDSVVSISNRVEEISAALSDQVEDVSEITTAVSQIDRNTQTQVASFEEVTAASALLSDEANELKRSTGRFKSGHGSETPQRGTSPRIADQRQVA